MSSSDKLVLSDKTRRIESIIRSKESTDNLSLTHEIECPRCHDTMILCSEFNRTLLLLRGMRFLSCFEHLTVQPQSLFIQKYGETINVQRENLRAQPDWQLLRIFTESLKSPVTLAPYSYALSKYMKYTKIKNPDDLLQYKTSPNSYKIKSLIT